MEETGGMKETRRPSLINPLLISTIILSLAVAFGLLYIFYLQPRQQVVVTINGENITRDELYEAMYEQVGEDTLEDLIMMRLIMQEGERLGLSVTEADIDEEIDSIVDLHFGGQKEQLLMAMEYYGMDMDGFRKNLKVGMMEEKIARSRLDFTDEEVREFFDENREHFNLLDEIELRHIMLDTEEEALAIIALLEAGEDFAELASEHSVDIMTGEQGGDLGVIRRGEMFYGFEDDAFDLEPGQISAPLSSYYGYHVVELLGKTAGREVSFEEVREEVEESYSNYLVAMIAGEIRAELMEKAGISYR